MGMNLSIYLGPYLKVPRKKTLREHKISGCPKLGCKAYKVPTNTRFCPVCGNPIIKQVVEVEATEGYFTSEVDKNFEEVLYTTTSGDVGTDILIANSSSYNLVKGDDEPYQLTDDNIGMSLLNFRNEHKELINQLQKEFPGSELCFGLVTHYL